ncbi:hypothetical protein HY357_04040 [Candidatus Roizmanbacteria bacterium]|nr:hypothetical protein [Candidatus Roizmanbacteria bacterium]
MKIKTILRPPNVKTNIVDEFGYTHCYTICMQKKKLPTNIPKSLYRYFWDVNPKKVNPKESPYFVINRLLDKGNVESVRWVIRSFTKEQIKETFKRFKDFRAQVGNFWSLFFQLPKKEVACLQPHYLKMRRMHWPY